jgi:WD40 repeat protein
MTKAQTANRCIACHVLSRDGKNMAITWDGGDQDGNTLDVATKTFGVEANAWNFGTFTPDGSQFLSVHGGVLVVRDYATQAVLATMTSGQGWVTHPDLSPDGTKLVYVHPTTTSVDWSFGGGQIWLRSYDAASLSFGPEQMLLADASNNYYPSFSPDGKWILFNKSDDNTTAGAYNDVNASLWVMKADGTGAPIELANANKSLGLTNSWGRWAPFAQTIGTNGEPIFWITTSSQRDFGVRLVGIHRPQIWMTAFHPERAAAGIDPTDPAFRLPFQNIDSNNHIAQWTEQIIATQ